MAGAARKRKPSARQLVKLVYRMHQPDIAALEKELKKQRYQAYREKLRELAIEVGCPQAANRAKPPRGASKRALDEESRRDAKSIAETWNRDVEKQIDNLFLQNPRGNRNYYAKHLEAWAEKRAQWKNKQIANYTVQYARNLARLDFEIWNEPILGDVQYLYTGAPPVGAECIFRMGEGVVDAAFARSHPTPAHPNCPHEWTRVPNGRKVNCKELIMG